MRQGSPLAGISASVGGDIAHDTKRLSAGSYGDLIAILVERKIRLGLTNLEVDEAGDMPSGYFGKLACGDKTMGLISLGKVLTALQCELVLVPRLSPPKPIRKAAENKGSSAIQLKNLRRKWGSAGGTKRYHLLTPARRRSIAISGGKAFALAMKLRRELRARGDQSPADSAIPGSGKLRSERPRK